MKYSLEEILTIFEAHAKEVEEKSKDDRIETSINLPAAFVCIIKEIINLKNNIDS